MKDDDMMIGTGVKLQVATVEEVPAADFRANMAEK
jgi:hypothetical protein